MTTTMKIMKICNKKKPKTKETFKMSVNGNRERLRIWRNQQQSPLISA